MLSSLSWLKYDEVAIPRILDMYRECGIKQTFFYPAWCMERYPHLVEMILKDGHEIAAHGYIHEDPNKLPREEEHYWLRRQIDVIEKMTGQRPRGWRGPLYNASKYSVDLLIEEGLIYDATLMGDDVPYVLKTAQGSVIELPSHWAMDDWPHYTHSFDFNYMMTIKSPDEAMNVFMSEFEAMYDFGGLWVTVWHPFVSGRLARCRRVQQMIEYMQSKGRRLVHDHGGDRQTRPSVHRRRQLDASGGQPALLRRLGARTGKAGRRVRRDGLSRHRRLPGRREKWLARRSSGTPTGSWATTPTGTVTSTCAAPTWPSRTTRSSTSAETTVARPSASLMART